MNSSVEIFDFVFVGGGLAAGLAAYRLNQQYPRKRILIIEKGLMLGGNHTWSFHDQDLTYLQKVWMKPFISAQWPCYEVQFPQYSRIINSPYYSLSSARFHSVILATAIQFRFNTSVKKMTPKSLVLESDEIIEGHCVIDARGWDNAANHVQLGFQKFVGFDLVLKKPHGLAHPVLMDAKIKQEDGFRFFYLLPWEENRLLIEDTHYSESSVIDRNLFHSEMLSYVKKKNWEIEKLDRIEQGCLPIPIRGTLSNWNDSIPRIGTLAGLFHATTSYSLAQSVRLADEIADLKTFEPQDMFEWTYSKAKDHWNRQRFYRFLNRMLFSAIKPEERYSVLQMFYKKNENLISRFYADKLTGVDLIQFFLSKPPRVSWAKLVNCFN
ncbi:MAG: lycopene beta-cyclase CrtY [Elusimicrobiota bacterium]